MDSDPWFWTASEVVSFFQNDAPKFCLDRGNCRLPESHALNQLLIANDVCGASLLADITLETLRSHLQVKSLAQASSVVHCIKKLRLISLGYRQNVDGDQEMTLVSHMPMIATPANSSIHTPILSSAQVSVTQINGLPSTTGPAANEERPPDFQGHPHESARSNEIEVEDGRGRKRRKLNLVSVEAERIPSVEIGHYSRAGLTVDKVFYGNTKVGEEIGELGLEASSLHQDEDADLGVTNFSFVGQHIPLGDRHFVSSKMRAFFMNASTIEFTRQGRIAVALRPYSDRDVPKGAASFATVFQMKPNHVDALAFKEHAVFLKSKAYLENGDDYHGMDQGPVTNERWDYLIDKWSGRDDEPDLIVDGSSISGEALENDDESISTGDEDMAEEEEEDDGIIAVNVAEYIDEHIESFARQWREQTLPRLEDKQAFAVWKKAHHSRQLRQALIASARHQIQELDKRIRNIKTHIMDDEWHSQSGLSGICESLRPSVEDQCLKVWEIDVWQREHAPRRKVSSRKDSEKSKPSAARLEGNHVAIDPHRPGHVHSHRQLTVSNQDDVVADASANDSREESFETAHDSKRSDPVDDFDEFIVADDEDILQGTPLGGSQDGDEDADEFLRTSPSPTEGLNVHTDLGTDGENFTEFSSEPGSDDDVVMPDVSTFFTQRSPQPKAEPQQTAAEPEQAKSAAHRDTIDLTVDSDPADSAPQRVSNAKSRGPSESPPIPERASKIAKPGAKVVASLVKAEARTGSDVSGIHRWNSNPLDSSAAEIESWPIEDLVIRSDFLRIVLKLLSQLTQEMRDQIKVKLRGLSVQQFIDAVVETANGIDAGRTADPVLSACLYIVRAFFQPDSLRGAHSTLDLCSEPSRRQVETLLQFMRASLKRPRLFQRQEATTSARPRTPDAKETSEISEVSQIIELSSDSSGEENRKTSRKKRKRPIKLSDSARKIQDKARLRLENFAQKAASQGSQEIQKTIGQGRLGPHLAGQDSGIVINPARADGDDPIHIHHAVASLMKNHQIEGVQFMWRELTAGDGDDEPHQGCILAHTMGLGKTMQTITTLTCLDMAAQSTVHAINQQVPQGLRDVGAKHQLRILILCPPTLLENWKHEILRWAPGHFQKIWVVDKPKAWQLPYDMESNLRDWCRSGGIFLIGYQKFRSMLKEYSEATSVNKIHEYLLKGPDIVVADEAHNLKNTDSAVTKVANLFSTPHRIGLTGTPMSNDIAEVYALVSWVAPGYLGEQREFTVLFTEPIKAGTYMDSSKYERRKSLMKLAVLRTKIEPKIHRADITALRGSLKPKVEFVITIPLTAVQHSAYVKYVTAILSDFGAADIVAQTQLFSWLAVLTLLTNHPLVFKRKLLDSLKKAKDAFAQLEAISEEQSRVDPEIEDTSGGIDGSLLLPPSEEEIDQVAIKTIRKLPEETITDIVAGINESLAPELSIKTALLLEIIRLSKKCNDQVLIFTSSLPTLHYLDEVLHESGIKFGRIEGNIPIKHRTAIIERFQKGQMDVLIISTKAGGVGLNIQSANRVILMDMGFNPTHEEQAVGRAYRLGQQKPVFVYRFLSGGTFEQNVYEKQIFKSGLASRVVDKKNPKRNVNRQPREWLHEPHEVLQHDLTHEAGKDPNVLDIMLADSSGPGASIRALKLMETLQEDAKDDPLTAEELRQVQDEIIASNQWTRNNLQSRRKVKAGVSAIPSMPVYSPRIPDGQLPIQNPSNWMPVTQPDRYIVRLPYDSARYTSQQIVTGSTQHPPLTVGKGPNS